MAATFPLDIVTPERLILSDSASSVLLPAANGSLGILAGHAPLVAALSAGPCHVRLASGAEDVLAIAGGFVEVTRERVTILADTAENAHEIDIDHAQAALAHAREMLANLSTEDGSTVDRTAMTEAVKREQARVTVARLRN